MDSTTTKPKPGRRFSFQSLRSSNTSTQDLPASTSNSQQPDAGLFAHRTLLHTARGSKPPTSGPTKSRTVSNAAPSSSSSSSHQHQRSMPSDISSLFGTVKRSLSFDRSRKSKPDASSALPTYVGTTADEDAARLYGLGPQRPLLPSPTFEQIASGMAVRSNRSSSRLPSSEPQHVHQHYGPPPRRSSMKKPSFSTANSSSTDFSNSVSSASPSYITPPLPTNNDHTRQLKHVTSTLASASSSSTCTSSSTSFSTGAAVPVSLPFPPQQQERKSHKLSLSLSTIKGRRASRSNGNNSNGGAAIVGLGLPMSNGKNNNSSSFSSVDSGVSWGQAAGGGADVSSKKAVRFSESEDGHANASIALASANSTPAVVVLDPRVASSMATTTTSTTKRQAKGEPRPQLVHLNSSTFADRTPKFLRR